MKKLNLLFIAIALSLLVISSCKTDDDTTPTLAPTISLIAS